MNRDDAVISRNVTGAGRLRGGIRAAVALAATGVMVATLPPITATAAEDGAPPGIRYHAGTAAPAQISGLSDEVSAGDPVVAARRHLANHQDIYHIASPAAELAPIGVVTDGSDSTVRFAQSYRGLPVFGAHYLVHLSEAGDGQRVTGATGRFFTDLDVDPTAGADEATAVDRAQQHVAAELAGAFLDGGDPPALTAESRGLVVLPAGGQGQLAYHVTVRGQHAGSPVQREVYLDARAAYPVLDLDGLRAGAATGTGETADGRTVDVELDSVEGGYELRDLTRTAGGITTWDGRGHDVSWVTGFWPSSLAPYRTPELRVGGALTAAGAVDAHVNAGHVYDYYAALGREGLDGAGGPIHTVTAVTSFGQPFINALWDGEKAIFGGGDADHHVLSAGLDIVAHELTHGVIQHTADLVYVHQSGAVNEAIADYFGNAVELTVTGTGMDDPDAGLIGEDICRTAAPRDCAWRDLNDGRTTADYTPVTFDYDAGGVHLNSTVFSGALWDIREALGGEVADRLVYKALSEYMTPLDDFADARAAVEAAGRALDLSQRDQQTVARAFRQHRIYDGWERRLHLGGEELFGPVTTTNTYPQAKGGVWVASNSDPSGVAPYQVFAGSTGGGEPVQLSDDSDPTFYHVHPATDGEWVVWAAWGSSFIRIMRAPADGSAPAEEVFRTGVQLDFLTVDGDQIAWQVTDSRFGSKVLYLDAATGEYQLVDNTFYQNSYAPYLHDGKLLYLNRDWRQPGAQLYPVVRDLATGEETTFPLPEYDPAHGIGWLAPRMSDEYVVTFVDTDGNGTGSLLRYPLDGGEPTVLLDETAADAVVPGQVDITGSAITFSDWPGVTVPKVHQVPTGGGAVLRVACSTGMQPLFDADTGGRVVYLDAAVGQTTLMVQDRARRHCPPMLG